MKTPRNKTFKQVQKQESKLKQKKFKRDKTKE